MKNNCQNLGLVTKKFNDYFLVDLKNQENLGNSERFLCKVRKSINFKDQLIFVGDEVVIDNIDLKSKRAVITSLKKRKNLLNRPSVANISNIYIIFSVEEPKLNLSQVNRFLISAESIGVEVSLVLTKCDLISDKRRSFLIDKFETWGYQVRRFVFYLISNHTLSKLMTLQLPSILLISKTYLLEINLTLAL